MLVDHDGLPVRGRAENPDPDADVTGTQIGVDLGHERVAGRADQREVELVVPLAGVPFTPRAGALDLTLQGGLHRLDGRPPLPRNDLGGVHLEHCAQLQHLVDLLLRDRRDEGAMPGNQLDQPLGGQEDQRLPNGGPRQPDINGDLLLGYEVPVVARIG